MSHQCPGSPRSLSHSTAATAKLKILTFRNVAEQFVRDKNKGLAELFGVFIDHLHYG